MFKLLIMKNNILSYFFILTLLFVLGFANIINNSSVSQNSGGDVLIRNTKLHSCLANEHWIECTAHCEQTCSNKDKALPCPAICVSGCVCDTGLVRDHNNTCVLPRLCPSLERNDDEFCPPNEKFSFCHAHCQRNCSNWSDHTLPCLKVCVPGCICKNGKVRGPHGDCIRPRQCISRNSVTDTLRSDIDCPVDEHFIKCKAHCQKNCSSLSQNISCSTVCIPGCVCDEGYARNSVGKCILIEKCYSQRELHLRRTNSRHLCPLHERKTKYKSLPNSEIYCTYDLNHIDKCPRTLLRGCVCKRNLVRGPNMKCIDSRLLPNANELIFMHENGNENDEINNSGVTENIHSASQNNNSEITNTSDSDHEQLKQSGGEKNFGGCPNFELCTQWCVKLNYNLGACIGKDQTRCTCIKS